MKLIINWRLEPELSGESRAIADVGSLVRFGGICHSKENSGSFR